jgi:hypothetical protein
VAQPLQRQYGLNRLAHEREHSPQAGVEERRLVVHDQELSYR